MSKKILLITLLFATITFGQYVAPNEDTVVIVGGLGTQADKNSLNGGGATKVAWDAGSPSDFIGTNGGTITADTAVTYSNGTTTFSKTGIGTGVTVGTLAYVSGTNITAGIYEITARTNDTIVCANIVAAGDNTDSVVNVGGALDGLQNALDNGVNNGASYSRFILYNISSVTLTVPIDIDTYGASGTTNIIVEGWNDTLAAQEQKTITTASDISALLNFNLGANHYIIFRNFILNAAGVNKANRCVYGTLITDDRVVFENCLMYGALDINAAAMNGDFWSFINCEIRESGGGIIAGSSDGLGMKIIGCSIHDNSGDGIHIEQGNAILINNIIYDNTGDGIQIAIVSSEHIIIGNTCYANDGDNIDIVAGVNTSFILNNVCVGSTGGYGFNLNGGNPYAIGFGYNLSAGNSSGHTDVSGTFADLGIGSNIASAQAAADIFVSVTDGSEDFTPKSGSDLIDNALDAGTN